MSGNRRTPMSTSVFLCCSSLKNTVSKLSIVAPVQATILPRTSMSICVAFKTSSSPMRFVNQLLTYPLHTDEISTQRERMSGYQARDLTSLTIASSGDPSTLNTFTPSLTSWSDRVMVFSAGSMLPHVIKVETMFSQLRSSGLIFASASTANAIMTFNSVSNFLIVSLFSLPYDGANAVVR
jgi:hypothetical protein